MKIDRDMEYPRTKILVFCKAPEPGKVKTRLQGALSAAQCAHLHVALARWALQTASDSGLGETELWCAGDLGHPFFKECAQRYGVALRQQQGPDLGARMADALQSALLSAASAIIIGTDCPGLDKTYLQQAAAFIENGGPAARVIIGPATDGGYVLFGANSAVGEAFKNIAWGSDKVLQQTRDRLHNLNIPYRELETLWDVDRPEDLQRLPAWLNIF
ncbi:MAG TPA: TIGR04282 family arsenosugar biosynthesis glycosyltransferase [Gammaproteobacteria bacterium]|nr:TIGR04282 family arsenosugar biosynthesis glycosyltransferase [Gammaproteobacteria bacterium]